MPVRQHLETVLSQKAIDKPFTVPPSLWNDLTKRDINQLCKIARAEPASSGLIQLQFLKDQLIIDLEQRCIYRLQKAGREEATDPYLELICLVYLLNAKENGLKNEMVGVNDLKDAHFFRGPHALRTDPLVQRFGNNVSGFSRAAEALGGRPMALADAAYSLFPFPKIPLYYLLWKGDTEFEPDLSVLFDRSIEIHLPADAIWALINLVSHRFLTV